MARDGGGSATVCLAIGILTMSYSPLVVTAATSGNTLIASMVPPRVKSTEKVVWLQKALTAVYAVRAAVMGTCNAAHSGPTMSAPRKTSADCANERA